MAIYCLTISVKNNAGGIIRTDRSPCSNGVPDGLGNFTCAIYLEEGEKINLTAIPLNSNWYVSSANSWTTSSGGEFSNFGAGYQTCSYTMPSSDSDIEVEFSQISITVNMTVSGSSGGCIKMNSPVSSSCYVSSGSVVLPNRVISVQVYADPDANYSVSQWLINGAIISGNTNTTLNFNVDDYVGSVINVVVVFAETGPCNENLLTVNIRGNGSVSPGSGSYCDWEILYLNPIPAVNSSFSHWEYSGAEIIQQGGSLIVPMSVNRTVTAVFVTSDGVQNSQLFYCSSNETKASLISFSYENNTESDVTRHFRLTFYSDYDRYNTVYSTFSYVSQKRWYYDDGAIRKFSSDGVIVPAGETYTIIFDPEVIPQSISEFQQEKVADLDGAVEMPLLCGVKYYLTIEEYNTSTTSIETLLYQSFILDCNSADGFFWSKDHDKNNWICSGQGQDDLKVSSSSDQTVFPDISSDMFDFFKIVWQGKNGSNNSIYSATWDSSNDIMYSSGQGFYDDRLLNTAFKPQIFVDQASNFYITGFVSDGLYYYACPMKTTTSSPVTTVGGESDDGTLVVPCYPGYESNLPSSYGELNVRVYEKDQYSSIVINKNKILPVINKRNIRFDISGIAGSYAVRIREGSNPSWGDWINIDNKLYYDGKGILQGIDDTSYDAFHIDNDRFIVPYNLQRINGVRRICFQILTLYGISRTFCIEVFMNISAIEYVFQFEEGTPTYNGMYVLTGSDNGNVVNFSVLFSEDIITGSSGNYFYNGISLNDYPFKFNLIQQGIDDQWGLPLNVVNSKKLSGAFTVFKHDGIFNKDGKAFIQVVFPDASNITSCVSDRSDIYNIMVNDIDASKYQNLSPEEVYKKYQSDKISTALNITRFKQYYNKDDDNFRFGNPNYYRND